MAVSRDRKQSEFLEELHKYYSERQKYSDSFADTSCPQNFIPGATKAKDVKLLRKLSRKVGSVCYRGVVIQLKDNMTPVEKGTIPAGLVCLAFPSPSQHTSCLEHKMGQILQRNSQLSSSTSTKSEDCTSDQEIQRDEDILLEDMKSKQRSCSLPTTKRDIGTLPIISYDDDCIFAEFGSSIVDRKRNRSSSYPLLNDDYEAHMRKSRSMRKFDNFAFDSASRLGALCRGMSYYGSSFKGSWNAQWKSKDDTSTKTSKRPGGLTFGRRHSNHQQNVIEETIEESESDVILQGAPVEEEKSEVANNVIVGKQVKERKYYSDPEDHIHSVKVKRSSSKLKSIRKRYSRKKKKKNEDSFVLQNTSKETLSQIQDALRAKLPKTFQATVKVGLSFDPVTVKERSDKAQQAKTLPRVLPGKNRSRSLTSSPQLVHNLNQHNVVADVPSVVVSPPTMEVNDEVPATEGAGMLANFLRLGKDTLTRKLDRWSYKNRRDDLKSASAADIACFQSLPEKRARKLENLLGAEFRELYRKERSNSLPLIKKRRVKVTETSTKTRSGTYHSFDIGKEGTSSLQTTLDIWSSFDTSDSDLSHAETSQELSMESELSDYDEKGRVDTRDVACFGEENVIILPSVANVITSRNNEKENSLDAVDNLDKIGHNDAEESPVQQVATNENGQNSDGEIALTSKKAGEDSHGSSPFKVQTSYVMNKSKLLKTSKELMEESKGQNLENVNIVKTSRKKSKRMQSDRKTRTESIQSNGEGNDIVLGKPSVRTNSQEGNIVKSRDERDTNETMNSEIANVSANNVNLACENELEELDALLAELEMFSTN